MSVCSCREATTLDSRHESLTRFVQQSRPTRKHTNNGMLSPVDYEMKQQKMNEAGVSETRGTSKIIAS
jgi:putative transposase